jgi:16S rRNA processing protein RimM
MSSVVAAPGEMVVMGQVLLPWGVRGWVKVRPDTETLAALLGFPVWWLRAPGGAVWNEVNLVTGREHSDALVVQLSGVETREVALTLKGCDIAVPRAVLPRPPADEIYQADLVGFEVVNRQGVALGRVVEVADFGAHPLLRLRSGAALTLTERLIPYVPAIVDFVDPASGTMQVDWGEDY